MESATFVDLLRQRATHTPNQHAYEFLLDGETNSIRITYAELDRRAKAIAGWLQSRNALGERALLLYPPGLEYIAAFLGCLYAGVIAVPAYPPQRKRGLPRVQAMALDSQAAFVLTTTSIHQAIERLAGQEPEYQNLIALQWITTDDMVPELERDWHEPDITTNTLAFLQYTSGSTGTPKGVMVSHGNLLHNERMIQEAFGHTQQELIVGWLPLYHDMGLIGNVLQPLYLGVPCVLMSPVHVLQKPVRWLSAISRYRATTSGGPNFAYDLCVQQVSETQRASLDLSSWNVAFNGAEPVHPDTLQRFAETFRPCGFRQEAFYPCYGLAEATLLVTGGECGTLPVVRSISAGDDDQQTGSQLTDRIPTLVGCGTVRLDQQIRIVHPELRTQCAEGRMGEVWVSGKSVAQGYWRQEEETNATFQAMLADTGEGPFLRTGDLGLLNEGDLFIVGRLKDLIIIRGRNHYPQDIERTVGESHPVLRTGGGVAFSIIEQGEERLVVVQEVEPRAKSINHDAVIAAVRETVAREHELAVSAVMLIKPGTLPKTSSGKVQRRLCRDKFLTDSLVVIFRSDPSTPSVPAEPDRSIEKNGVNAWNRQDADIERIVTDVWAQILNRSDLKLQDNFFAVGGDSLRGMQLVSRLSETFHVDLSLHSLFEYPTIRDLARAIEKVVGENDGKETTSHLPGLQSVSRDRTFPLSLVQQRLWLLQQLEPETSRYHLAGTLRLTGKLDAAALERSFRNVLLRHEALRTYFPMVERTPRQVVDARSLSPFAVDDFNHLQQKDQEDYVLRLIREKVRERFDLETTPPLRAGLIRLNEETHIFWLFLHHLIFDGLSAEIFVREFLALYEAEVSGRPLLLPQSTIQYIDYSLWQRQSFAQEKMERSLTYWKTKLHGAPETLALPTDRPRPPVRSDHGALYSFSIAPELVERLMALSRLHGVTLFMTMLTAWKVLLYKYTAQGDICVGVPVAGRNRPEIEGLIGFFVNTVVLRSDLSDNPAFATLLDRVSKTMLEARLHEHLPFERLVEVLKPTRELNITLLFQVMFSWRSELRSAFDVAGLHVRKEEIHNGTAKFDLTLEMLKTPEELRGSFEYSTDLFDKETIARMAGHYQTLLKSLVAQPNICISDLPMLVDAERHQMVVEWNATTAAYPQDHCLHQLFEAQATKTPDAVAVRFQGQQLTYRELNDQADRLARGLRGVGVGPEVLVGLCVDRSLEMMVGLLGILKAGGAYVPMDPTYPYERIDFMLKDAEVAVLLTQYQLLDRIPTCTMKVICLDTDELFRCQEELASPVSSIKPENLVYVLYTSGSTGRPKGVMISHRSAVNFLWAMQAQLKPIAHDLLLAVTSLSFDIALLELFLPLIVGATVMLAEKETVHDGVRLSKLLEYSGATIMQATPATWRMLLDANWMGHPTLKVLCGGEALSPDLAARLLQQVPAFCNLYGPTETTVWSAMHPVIYGEGQIPIGHPVANTQIYILDSELQSVPIGVAGEIYIGGDGLARGYWMRPDLTADRFVPNPFSDRPRRLYRTGDMARYRNDGNIEYLGRLDHQVKIRGFRIELGEIEAVLESLPGIRATVVMAREDSSGDRSLVAYVVTDNVEILTSEVVRTILRQKLPHYMIPSTFVFLEELPLTPNGKIDRKALPYPEARPQLTSQYVSPRTPTEKILAEIWSQILGVKRIGLHDNFFDLGGHSLLLVEVHHRIEDTFETKIPVADLFRFPTISTMANRLSQGRVEQMSLQHHQVRASQQRTAFLKQRDRKRLRPEVRQSDSPKGA